MNQRFVLSHRDALKILAVAQAELERDNKGAAVAVSDSHGELIALLRTDGCPLASINNAINKAYTAARERKESKEVGNSSREKAWPMTNFGDLRYIGWGGGVPIFHEGQCVGAVGISGLPEEEDMVIARKAAKALEG
jgi:glc operon protein GlcG